MSAKLPFLVLAVSILLTIGVTCVFYQSAKNKDAVRFATDVNRLQLLIENRVNLYIALLKGGRGFIESNRATTHSNFAEYVRSLDLDKNYAGVQGIGYAEVVPADKISSLTEKIRAEDYAEFKVFPATEKDSYTIALYLEPSNERNQRAVGFDLSSETIRNEALNRARDSGEAASSSKINLLQENESGTRAGFLICLPIYRNSKLSESLEEKRKNIAGYIYSPFHADKFLNEIQNDKSSADVLLKIYDGEVAAENLLAQTAAPPIEISQNQIEKSYAEEKTLNVAGRKWIVQYDSLPAFSAQSSVGWSPLIFLIGIAGSCLLFSLTYWETMSRIKLQTTAADLVKSEEQKQMLLEKEQSARLSAEQANRTKDEFIAVVSHELKTPLNAIAGWTRILQTADLSPNTRKTALEKIEKSLRLQKKMVEELLEFSQIVARKTNFDEQKINFSEIFEYVFAEIATTAGEKKIELLKDNKLNGQTILGNEDKLKIVIHNLLMNAVKFTDSGGKVETSVLENDGAIKMIVKDNGKGISSNLMPHIFDRFIQADASTTRNLGGLGLGLTISHHIVKLHNGKIEASSEGIDKGSIFTVTLPVL